MVSSELDTFSKIISYLNEIDDTNFYKEKIHKAVEQTKFEELQKMEKKEGFTEKGKGKLFFRKGKICTWKDEVPNEIIKKIEKIFYNEMVELGYL